MTKVVERKKREFLKEDLDTSRWESFEPYFQELLSAEFTSAEDFKKWILKTQELYIAYRDGFAWSYINKSRNTNDPELETIFMRYITEVSPKFDEFSEKIERKMVESPFAKELPTDYNRFLKLTKTSLDLFRQENLEIEKILGEKTSEFGKIIANQSVEFDGETKTLPQMSVYYQSYDRDIREKAWHLVQERKLEDFETLNLLYSELLKLRHKLAQNAGFKNYRDYTFKALNRDYTPEQCFEFHRSTEKLVHPFTERLKEHRAEVLGLEKLRPWDLSVDIYGKEPLKPFENSDELVDKTITIFNKLKSGLGDKIETMRAMGQLDLDSRLGKETGGYNYGLYETHVPFIFMNTVGVQRDVVVMLHEGGHAIHTFATKDHDLVAYKGHYSEVAELASMSMELITMDFWDEFYKNEDELKRAKREQIEGTVGLLDRIMQVDAFQHWVYENPEHTEDERIAKWMELEKRFNTSAFVDRSGLEHFLKTGWQFSHVFERPFYYIEYAIAQLGALQVWRNYTQNPEKAVNDYLAALELGGTVSTQEVYERAGIKFDFSADMIASLIDFAQSEWEKLNG
ncbi:MAG TPA: M3 family oligoendopeptidase [Patescibacteria group bacterium]|nr:M3 family oligoendopeptidase [Patescibacteria group bacterium]